MRDYFEAELRLLHESAQEFARHHPEQARMLNLSELRDRDPYIERLLEGMAFLSAHVRRRIDEAQVAVSEQLLAHVCPQQLSPYPSTTIVQFQLEAHRQARQDLPAGLELLSEPVGKQQPVQCRFRTTRALAVQPLTIEEASAEEKGGNQLLLRLVFRHEGNGRLDEIDLSALPIFLHADYPLAAALYLALTRHVRELRLRPLGGEARARRVGGQACLRPLHLEADDALMRHPHRAHPGFDLLQDYFLCREKYLFVELALPEAPEWPAGSRRFELEILCEASLPPEHKLSADNLRLHCAPAVNLFSLQAEPIELDHRRTEYRVVPDSRYPTEMLVCGVERVSGREHKSGAVHEYKPLYALASRRRDERYFHAQRRDYGGPLAQTYITLGGQSRLERETLSCEVTACNAHLPRQHLHENQIRLPSPQVPSGVKFRNITRPSPMFEPPAGADYPWRLNALLTLNVGSLANADTLRQLLELFEWSNRREHRQRIDGIVGARASALHKVVGGVLHRGVELRVEVQEDRYPSWADIHLFGQVLHRFFSLSCGINEFVQTRVVGLPSYKEQLWSPRLGQSSPI